MWTHTDRPSRLALACLLLLPACAPAGPRPEERFTASSHCALRAERACEREERECRLEREWAEDDCWTACLSIGDCSTCARVAAEPSWCNQCRHAPPETAERPCVDWAFSFRRASVEDPSVGEACRRYLASAIACGDAVVGDPCADFARVERSEVSAVYDCWADAACDPAARAACELPPVTHGIEHAVCSLLEGRCGTRCSPELSSWLASTDGWLRTDVAVALQECVDTPACDDYVECVNAWLDEVRGD